MSKQYPLTVFLEQAPLAGRVQSYPPAPPKESGTCESTLLSPFLFADLKNNPVLQAPRIMCRSRLEVSKYIKQVTHPAPRAPQRRARRGGRNLATCCKLWPNMTNCGQTCCKLWPNTLGGGATLLCCVAHAGVFLLEVPEISIESLDRS